MNRVFLMSSLVTLSTICHSADSPEPIKGYPNGIREIRYPVAADNSEQPSLFWSPELAEGEKTPLLVAMHTWSGDYRQAGGEAKYAEWCLKNNWIFVHPNFRGRNRSPESMGSDLMIADVRAIVEWAKKNASVDETRIYAIGVSGGGHATQLLAGRTPEIWAGISSWCGISDIAAWHDETSNPRFERYSKDIEIALGGPPGAGTSELEDSKKRSPLSWLSNASGVPLDINHGIDDGRTGSVPFTHSLYAWNEIVPDSQKLSEKSIDHFYESQQSPEAPPAADALYGKRQPVFRRAHENTRITIFRGGHEIIHLAALNWLAAQQKGQPTNWNPPMVSDLDTTDLDTESGK
jgi:pimeloyl-ACP methyl ester carboxylesterase